MKNFFHAQTISMSSDVFRRLLTLLTNFLTIGCNIARRFFIEKTKKRAMYTRSKEKNSCQPLRLNTAWLVFSVEDVPHGIVILNSLASLAQKLTMKS